MLTPIQTGVWTLEPMLNDLFESLDALQAECPEGDPWRSKMARVLAEVRDDYGWILANALDAAEKVQARTKEIADAVKGELAPPNFEAANLNESAQEVVRSLRPVAENAGLQLKLDLDPALPLVQFDRKQIYNAMYNLVNNAIPETPVGGSVTVRTRRPDPSDDIVVLEVEDTGRGMPEHVRQSLFSDKAISTKPGGTGLGTRIVKGIIDRHNGTIEVAPPRDSQGSGTTFVIRLPFCQPAD